MGDSDLPRSEESKSFQEAGSVDSVTFEKLQQLLKARDDTSRFVGLALLKSLLDNGQLTQDAKSLRLVWEAISSKFLDRLLRAKSTETRSIGEASNMVDLAVSILHMFTKLLPNTSRSEQRLTARIVPLVNALVNSSPQGAKLILQILLTLATEPAGSRQILSISDVSPLVELANQDSIVLDIFKYTWINSSVSDDETGRLRKSISNIMPRLILTFRGTDAVTLIKFVGDVLPKLKAEVLPQNIEWVKEVIFMIQKLVSSRPTAAGRASYTQAASSLLQSYPNTCPSLLFGTSSTKSRENESFSYLFISLLLTDLRSSFPSLLAKLNSDDYATTAQRLTAAFDIISSFIGFLVSSLDDESSYEGVLMPPGLLLKLRKNLAETLSLTIEYLRDRWDASVAGAAGLHPSARAGTAATSQGTRLTLTWESMKDNINTDTLILAGLRTLAMWVREDDNENLRNESAGLMDMWIELYNASSQTDHLDFRYPVLLALESVMEREEALDAFLQQEGWQTLARDLDSITRSSLKDSVDDSATSGPARGLQIVRVLLQVVDHTSTPHPNEDWMAMVSVTAAMKSTSRTISSVVLEFQIAMIQLSVTLLANSAGGMTKRHVASYAPIAGLIQDLRQRARQLDDKAEANELMELLDDAALEMDNVRR